MRQHRVMMDGEFPHELKAVFHGYEVQGNPWGLPADTRGDWARGLDVPVVQSAQEVAALDYLFYVGSAESFDPRGQKIAKAFASILLAAGVRFAILGPGEPSTGECVRRAGNEMLFQELAKKLVETLNGLGVTRIVTCDPHAFNSLKNEYPAFGGHWQVMHHSQLIAQLLREGRIQVEQQLERVMLHDPCYLGRHNGEFDAPRAVIAGPRSGIIRIRQVEVDPEQSKIFVAVKNNAESYRFEDASPSPWNPEKPGFIGVWDIHDNGDVPPRGVIKGPASEMVWPAGVALNPADREVYTIDSVSNGMYAYYMPEFFPRKKQ